MTSFAHTATVTSPRSLPRLSRRAAFWRVAFAFLDVLRDNRTKPKRLSEYLNEELADETLHLEIAKRAASENVGMPLWAFLELLSWELEEDRDVLEQVMRQLGVRRSRARLALARTTGRLAWERHPRLSLELESLQQGIDNKISMWNTLRSSVAGVDFDALISRAKLQAEQVERRRLGVAGDEFAAAA